MPKLSRIIALLLALSLWSSAVLAEDCEPAVDMMESNDAVNRMGDCDYSDEGLNGWLSGRAANESPPESDADDPADASALAPAGAFTLTQTGIKTALDLLQARFDLVAQAAERCAEEAVLSEESYILDSPGSKGLNMKFYCR